MKTKRVYNHGINDLETPITSPDGKILHFYTVWANMLRRCYCPNYQLRNPTYHGCYVDPEWHTLSNFKRWYEQQGNAVGLSLDKDILTPSKVYGPSTCVFVPQWLNLFVLERSQGLTGAIWEPARKGYCPRLKKRRLGCFKTPQEAHIAWKKAKLELVHAMKPEFDAADSRIYPALVQRYEIAS
jgi:hypothetical protein